MKKFIHKLLAFLMALVMLFEAAPVASLAEAPIVTDVAEGKKLDITLPSEPALEESHTLTEGEYSITPVDDISALLDLIDQQAEVMLDGGLKTKALKRKAVSISKQAAGAVAYEINLTEEAVAAKEYQVTVPVGVDMLGNYRDFGEILVINKITYQLYHIHTDEDGNTSVEPIDSRVTDSEGQIIDFTFTTSDFSTFVLKYTVDFVYENAVSTLSINLENFQDNSNELLQLVQENNHYVTILPVADILADAPTENEEEQLCPSIYVLYLHENASKGDYSSEFFASAAVSVEGTGIEVSGSTIRLTADVAQGKVTFTGSARTLEVEISNYVAPPIVPEDVESFAYRFFAVGETAAVADILAANEIVSSYYSIVSLSEAAPLTVDGDTLTAQDYFDKATLTVALSDGTEVQVALTNPAPVQAGETVTTAGVGTFAADKDVPAGTMLVVDSNPVVPEGIVLPGSEAEEQAEPVFFEVSLVGPDGEPVRTGADVTLNTAIKLPEAPEGQIVKVTGVKVYHIGEKGDAEELEGATFALAEGRISSVSFTTPGFSLFAITYTVEYIEINYNGVINLDFTGFEPYPKEGVDATFIYDTDNCDIRVSVESVLSIALNAEAAGDGVISEKAEIENFEIDWTKVETVSAEGFAALEEGVLVISGDGSIVLSDGEKNLTINVTGITKLSEEILKADGVEIKVEEGNIPLGSQAQYTQNSEEKTASLVEEHKLGEGEENIAGYSSADLKIVRNDEPVNAEGQFKVTLEKSSLIPAGMKLDKLYHIHTETNEEGEIVHTVETLEVTETEDGLVFEVKNFSDIVASYTVDFEYNGYKWSFPGTGRYAIADIMSEIGVEGTITDVQLARTINVGGADNALYLSDDHTELVSDVAFQDTFELTVKVQQTVEEKTVEKTYVIVVKDSITISKMHNATLNIEAGVNLPDYLHIVFIQYYDDIQSQDYTATNQKLVSICPYVANETEYIGTFSYSVTELGNWHTEVFLACGKQYNETYQEYMIDQEDQGFPQYHNNSKIDGRDVSITTDDITNTTVINIGTTLPTTYSVSFGIVDQTGGNTTPNVNGYTLVGSDGTYTYTANLTNGPLSFTRSSDSSTVTELPRITSWTFKDSSNNTVTAIDGFELSTTPETTTVSSNETSVLKNYAFTATRYQNCGLSIEGLMDTNAVANYWVLVKQGSEYKYYAKMDTLGTICNADGTSASAIKGSSGYEFEVVEYSDTPNSVNDLSNQQKKPNPFPITVSGDTKLVSFPTQATEQSGNYNYVFTVAEPPMYSAALSFVQENGTTPVVSTGMTGEYYVLIKISDNGDKFALSESPIDLANPTPVTFDTFDDNSSHRYLANGEILEAWLVQNTSGSSAPSLDNAKKGTNVTQIQLTSNAILGGYEWSANSAQNGNWTSTFRMLPKYSATFSFMQSNGTTPVTSTGITDSYYVLIKAGDHYALSENPVDFTKATDTVTFEEFFDNNNTSIGSKHYKNDTIQEIYLVKNVADNIKPSIANARTDDSSFVTKIQLQESAAFSGYVLSAPTFQNGAWSGTFTEVPNYSANIQVIDTDGSTQITNPSISGTYYYLIKTNIDSEKYALSEQPVDFSGANPAEFTTFYNNNGTGEVVSGYSGNKISEVYLVSPNASGQRPSITEAYSGSNGVQKYGVGAYTINNVLENRYLLTGKADGASYLVTASRMPAYRITSSFNDGGTAIPKALSNEYYLVAKATIGVNPVCYIDTYDPERVYEITHFYTAPNLTGGGNDEDKTAFVNDSTVEVYLVKKANAADANAAITATGENKISSGTVEIYTLAQDNSTTSNQTALIFTKDQTAPETYTTTIKFFADDAQIIEAAGDIGMHVDEAHSTKTAPTLTKNYYVLATLTNKADKSIAGWAINPVTPNGHAETSTLFTEFIPYGTVGSTTEGTKIPFSSSDDFPYNVSTRLYRTDAALSSPTYYNLVTNSETKGTDSAEDGYEFVGNWNPDATHNEIHLKEASPKTYAVRVRFKSDDFSKLNDYPIGADKKFMVDVRVTHASTLDSYQYAQLAVADFASLPVDDEGYPYYEFTFDQDTNGKHTLWRDANGTLKNAGDSGYFTGNESNIQVRVIQLPDSVTVEGYKPNNYADSTKYEEGKTLAGVGYMVHYDTRWTSPQGTMSKFHEERTAGSEVVKCYDIVDLILPNADSEYDYSTILGPNYAFGIVADHLFQNNDLQTNFAVNHYTGHGDYITPDLSNTSGTIVIGEFNRNTDVMAENHVGPAVDPNSTDSEDMKAGTVPLGTNILGSLAIYVDDDSGARYDTYGVADGTPVSEQRNNVHVYMQNGASLQSQIVNPGIQYGVNMSRTLAAKDATYTPGTNGNGPYVDTTGFPDNATIYIDADSMLSVASEQPDDVYGTLYELRNLQINKRPGQMLIFNFKNTTNVKLNQFQLKYESETDYFATNTTTNQSTTNENMEDISKHIVWNFASCTRRVELSEVGGICLQPNYGSETEVSGTSGGWLVSAGFVFNSSAEWHNFFQEVPDSTEVTLRVLKTVDEKVPAANEVFDFELSEYSATAQDWTLLDTQTNTRGSVKFTISDKNIPENERKLTPGWHVYKIVEKQQKHTPLPEGVTNTNNYIFDSTVYYAAVQVINAGTGLIAAAPLYFKSFAANQFNTAAVSDGDVPTALTDPLVAVTFKNEVKKEGLTLCKTVEGTDSSKVPFTFTIQLWSGDQNAVLGTDSTTALSEEYTVTGLAGTSKITLETKGTEEGKKWSEGTLVLKNGQSATITGLPENTRYRITETYVNGDQQITYGTTTPVDGYVSMTDAQTGTVVTGGVKEEFVNEYHAAGNITLHAHKALKNAGSAILPEGAYGFELYQGGTRIVEHYPDGNGNDATRDVFYNDQNGNVTFPQLHYTEADMEGATLNPSTGKRTKVLTYRVHEINGNVFGFAYDQFINDADKTVIVTLLDEGDGTIRAVGLPTDFTFRFNNEKAIEVVLEGSKLMIGRDMKSGEVFRFIAQETVDNVTRTVATATLRDARDGEETAFTFTPIKYAYTEEGTYPHTYTISEVTGTITDINYDTTTSYTATVTITVDRDGNATSAVSYSGKAPFINTSKNTTSASVEKVWTDGNQNHTSDSVKVQLYKVIGNAIDPQPTFGPGEEPTAYVGYGTDEPTGTGGLAISPRSDLPQGAVAVSKTMITLSKANNWKYTWSKLPTMERVSETWKYVSYYPVEVWCSNASAELVGYSTIERVHKVIITNEMPQTADLTVTKTVKLNGTNDTTHTDSKTFYVGLFTRTGDAEPYSYTLVGSVQSITLAANSATDTATFSDLDVGSTYYVFETDSTGETRYEGGTIHDGYTVTYGATQEVTISPTDAENTASVTNNQNTGALKLQKIVTASTDGPVSSDLRTTNGQYNFTITGPSGSAEPITRYVAIRTDATAAAGPVSYTYKVAESAIAEDDETGFEAVPAGGVEIPDLPTGTYTITETDWQVSSTTGAAMCLDTLVVTNDGNAVTSITERTATVTVTAGNTASVPTATFTNKMVPTGINVKKLIADYNDSMADDPGQQSSSENPTYDSADYDVGDYIPYHVMGWLPNKAFYKAQTKFQYTFTDVMTRLTYCEVTDNSDPVHKAHVYVAVKGNNDTTTWYQVDDYFNITWNSGTKTLIATTKTTNGLKDIVGGYPVTSWDGDTTHTENYYPHNAPTLGSYVTFSSLTPSVSANDIENIQLRYWATLDSNAAIGATGNPNQVKASYVADSNYTAETGWDVNKVFTYKLQVRKTDGTNDLSGATFQLYKKYYGSYAPHYASGYSSKTSADNSSVTFHLPSNMASGFTAPSVGGNVTGDYWLVDEKTTGSVFAWECIDDGDYLLVETAKPSAYEGLPGAINIKIEAEHETDSENPQLKSVTARRYIQGVEAGEYCAIDNDATYELGTIKVKVPNYKNGQLTINKQIDPAEDATLAVNKTFTFKVTFKKNGEAVSVPVRITDSTRNQEWVALDTDGSVNVQVTGAGSVTIDKIPAGLTYTVEELNDVPGWKQVGDTVYSDQVSDSSATPTIQEGDTDSVTITNKKQPGTLILKKKILKADGTSTNQPWNGAKGQEFTYCVSLYFFNSNGDYRDDYNQIDEEIASLSIAGAERVEINKHDEDVDSSDYYWPVEVYVTFKGSDTKNDYQSGGYLAPITISGLPYYVYYDVEEIIELGSPGWEKVGATVYEDHDNHDYGYEYHYIRPLEDPDVVTISNKPKTGTLIIHKDIEGGDGSNEDFYFDVNFFGAISTGIETPTKDIPVQVIDADSPNGRDYTLQNSNNFTVRVKIHGSGTAMINNIPDRVQCGNYYRKTRYTIQEVDIPDGWKWTSLTISNYSSGNTQSVTDNIFDYGTNYPNIDPNSGITRPHEITLVNKPKTTTTAQKLWKDAAGNDLAVTAGTDYVKFQLYRSQQGENAVPEAVGSPVTVDGVVDTPAAPSGENAAWVYTWDNLDKYYWNAAANSGAGAWEEYVYTAVETAIKYSGDAETAVTDGTANGASYSWFVTAASSGNATTVTNKLCETSVPLSATKTMAGGETPGEYSFTLTAANGTPMPTLEGITPVVGDTNTTMTVSNTGESISFGSIRYTLANMRNAGNTGYDASKTFIYTVQEVIPSTATAANNYTVGGVKYDPAVYTVTVIVTYNSSPGELTATPTYSKTVGVETITEGITGIAFVNEELTDLAVTKQWKAGDTVLDWWPANTTVTVGLYRKPTGDSGDPSAVMEEYTTDGGETAQRQMTVVLTADKQSDTFTNLPVYDNGVAYEYSVKETSVTINGTTYTIDGTIKPSDLFGNVTSASDGTITVINQLPNIQLNVIKVAEGTTTQLNGAKFRLTRKLVGEENFAVFENDAFEADTSNENKHTGPFTVDGAATISNLLPGDYQLTEVAAPAGYTIMSSTIEFTVNADGTVAYSSGDNSLITFAHKSSSAPATFTVGNTPGVELPATGGPGTAVYTVTGLTLLLGASLWLFLRRKKQTT